MRQSEGRKDGRWQKSAKKIRDFGPLLEREKVQEKGNGKMVHKAGLDDALTMLFWCVVKHWNPSCSAEILEHAQLPLSDRIYGDGAQLRSSVSQYPGRRISWASTNAHKPERSLVVTKKGKRSSPSTMEVELRWRDAVRWSSNEEEKRRAGEDCVRNA